MKNKAAKKQADQQYSNEMAAAQQQREWQLEDRDEERAYNRAQLDETREYSRQVLSHLVEDAEKAGFNPLTALRAGSGASYNAAAGLAPLSATPITRQAPVKQAVGGSPLGDAVSGIGDFISNFDPFADQKREQEYRLVESQIAALNASALSGAPRGSASFATGGLERRLSGQGGALSRSSAPVSRNPGDWFHKPHESGDAPTLSTLGMRTGDGKYGWFENPWTPDGQTFENNYGEVGGAVYGVGKFLLDGAYSAYRNRKSAVDDISSAFRAAKVKPSAKARREYFKNIRESVPSLAR
ncbi:MAG: hypothetical protein JSR13_17655 [Proteobacteria bacterium]|nr:hypothetical protein [Pseudomonadota bacterium]